MNMPHRPPAAGTPRPGLLYCGAAAALLFHALVLVQALLRPGYDLVRLPLSLLALGPWGWVQTLNFLMTGLLLVGLAVGTRHAQGSGPRPLVGGVLLAFYGVGMVVAALYPSDPENGFPLGASRPEALSRDAQMHGMGFLIAQVSLILACLVFAYGFARLGARRWAAYCLATALCVPAGIVLAFALEQTRGLAFFATGALGLCWAAALGLKLMGPRWVRPGSGLEPASAVRHQDPPARL